MVTKRDVVVALTAAGITLAGAHGIARRAVLDSSIFDWNATTPVPNKTGFVRKVVQQPTATLDELEIHITTLNPGESPHEPHKHPDEELVIVKEGTVEFLVNGQKQTIGPGSIVFQASNQLHSVRNVGAVPAIYHVIKWNSPGMLKQKTGGE